MRPWVYNVGIDARYGSGRCRRTSGQTALVSAAGLLPPPQETLGNVRPVPLSALTYTVTSTVNSPK